MQLHEALAQQVTQWRLDGYPCETYPAIAEILEWAANPDGAGFRLRAPQVWALETYWYLRLIEGTPHIFDLYRRFFPKISDLLRALDIPPTLFEQLDYDADVLWRAIRDDAEFAKTHKLEALQESLTLAYPSYIFALAMGAGKTVLIGAIIASEFAMSDEYRDGRFVENALVFAPGKTIIESLRELAEIPYERILPPRLYRTFAASLKLTFTRDGDPDIPVVHGSAFNLVVTNTEKIRIQKETVRKKDLGSESLLPGMDEEAKAAVANRRLQAIASLPNLGIFSDEAHHTYGNSLDRELKRVRQTVDYLHQQTDVVCVVNTTGTPYYRRQLLRDVVIWYPLSQGIREGILKEVAGNIRAFDLDDTQADDFVAHVVESFFADYGDVALPNGAPAKLAIYFPQTDDLAELRPTIEATLVAMGLSPTIVLRNTSESSQEEIDAFNRLGDPSSPHRVILLVNKGTEGWDCPSLFSCALARRLKGSNNFVLQAASRCLRQVPGNDRPARIYLSMDNRAVLEKQLQDTYGESLADLDRTLIEHKTQTIILRKVDMPPLVVKQIVRTVVPLGEEPPPLRLDKPEGTPKSRLEGAAYDLAVDLFGRAQLQQVGRLIIDTLPETVTVYTAAVQLAERYRVDLWQVSDELRRLFGDEVPVAMLPDLAMQIEQQTRRYTIKEEVQERALALVRPDGFTREWQDGALVYTAEIVYPVDREELLLSWEQMVRRNEAGVGFHYSPYNFDSRPEVDFFQQLLSHVNMQPSEVEDIYFTGALTDPLKTEFYVDYLGEDGRWHRYTPDFVIRRRDGLCLIVEIKSAQFRAATEEDLRRHAQGEAAITTEGRKAVALRRWQTLNPEQLSYAIVYASGPELGYNQTEFAREFVEGKPS